MPTITQLTSDTALAPADLLPVVDVTNNVTKNVTLAALAAGMTTVVHLAGAETVTGAKTFSSTLIANGNVGIGTLAPAYPLDVAGAVNATSYRSSGYTAQTLLYSGYAALNPSFASAANTTTQVVGNCLITLPIINKSCTVKITIQFLSGFGAGNNNVYGAIGATATGLGNTGYANVYAGGAQTQYVYSNVGIVTLSLATQQYVSMTIQNDASTSIAFSANGFRTALLVEVYA